MTPNTALRQRDHAYSNFTEKLLARDLKPGQIVSQRELVDLTGMPLGAIREMIPRLEADGLIKTVPKRGLQVLSIDLDLVRNAFQLRDIIEGEAISEFCKTATSEEIDLLVPHQANLRIIEAVGKRFGIDKEKVYVNVDRFGNTSAASIPIALDEARRSGRIKAGDLVAMVTFGAGLTWAAALYKF